MFLYNHFIDLQIDKIIRNYPVYIPTVNFNSLGSVLTQPILIGYPFVERERL